MKNLAFLPLLFLLVFESHGQWSAHSVGSSSNLFCLSGAGQNWLAGSFGSVFLSQNDGATWTERELKDSILGLPVAQFVRGARLETAQKGIVAGTFFTGNDFVTASSTDGFLTLQFAPVPASQFVWPREARDLYFLSQNVGFVCGNGQALARTLNGGATWVSVSSATNPMAALDFFDDEKGVAVGTGLVLRTTDGGVNWQSFFNPLSLIDASMASPTVVFAVSDNGFFRSNDGGATWAAFGPEGFGFRCVRAVDAETALVGTSGGIFLVENGGAAWSFFPETSLVDASGTGLGVNQIVQNGSEFRAVCDGGRWLRAANFSTAKPRAFAKFELTGGGCDTIFLRGEGFAGDDWTVFWQLGSQKLADSTRFERFFTASIHDTLRFVVQNPSGSDTIFWPIGREAILEPPAFFADTIFRCDGLPVDFPDPPTAFYQLWEPQSLFVKTNQPPQASFVGTESATVVGFLNFGGCWFADTIRIEILSDRPSEFWHPTATSAAGFDWEIEFLSDALGFALEKGGDKFIRTEDGGATWSAPVQFFNPSGLVGSMDFVNDSAGFVAFGPVLFRTFDAGQNWAKTEWLPHLLKIHFYDENVGFAVAKGQNSFTFELLKTTDGGLTWTKKVESTGEIRRVRCRSANDCWAVGYDFAQPQIWRTTDLGETWKKSAWAEPLPIWDFDFLGGDSLIAIDWSAVLHFSPDGGDTWPESINLRSASEGFASQIPVAVAMVDALEGYASFEYRILKTFDGGRCWQRLSEVEKAGAGSASSCAFPSKTHRFLTAQPRILRLDSVPFVAVFEPFWPKKETERLEVWPNPAASGEPIFLSQGGFFEIFDCLGQRVFVQKIEKGETVELPFLPAGAYFLSLQKGEKKAVGRLAVVGF